MEELGCIYYIYCIETNKGYVGQSVHADHRIRYRKHWAKKNVKTYLCNAMNKYNKDAFTIQTLCLVPHSALNNMEAYWAEQLETYIWDSPGGYNMVLCGGNTKGYKHTEENKLKMSKLAINKWKKKEEHKKASIGQTIRYQSDEERKKMSIRFAGISNRPSKSGELLISKVKNSWRVKTTSYMHGTTFSTLEEAIIYRDSFLIPYKNGTSP